MTDALHSFITHARGKGLDHATIRLLLQAAGWKDKDIARGIAAEGLDVSVPEPAGSGNARDSFIYLMSFVTLYVVVTAIIVLYYMFLDFLFPDPGWELANVDAFLDVVRYAIAAVIVAFPLFLILSQILERLVRRTPDSHKQPVARWLTYLTMFLAAAVMMGDLITLLFYFLDGSVTTRFVLKVVVLFVIAEVILSYYYLTPRTAASDRPSKLRPLLASAGIVIVVGAATLGFVMAGSPMSARLVRLDDRRVADLREIHQAIQQMTTERKQDAWVTVRPLPTSLEDVAAFRRTKQSGRELSLLDPQSGAAYEFRVTGEKSYELCGTFTAERKKTYELFWNHPAGKHCYSFNTESPP